ncbi:MAG: CPBP family intramembrane metalloprotease [Verrucomicrobiota bacterium]|nr:CPBP family intramembrane metalloprotease [Verrucomicrobiota bacterium]
MSLAIDEPLNFQAGPVAFLDRGAPFVVGAVDPWRRAYAWGAMLVASQLPNILVSLGGWQSTTAASLLQILIIVVLAVIADRSPRLRSLTGFLLTLAILRLGWYTLARIAENSDPIHHFVTSLSWGGQVFAARALNTIGGLLVLTTFIGRRLTRQDLFLSVGDLTALAQPEPPLWLRRPMSWIMLGPLMLVVFGVALPMFLYFSLHPDFAKMSSLWIFLPWILATSVLNAANEEFQFRCVPLAHLRGALPAREAVWLTAIFFGIGHFFGQPSGWIGVGMASIAGWIWGKSMVETRGVVWAFGIHMVQDVVILCFLALTLKN